MSKEHDATLDGVQDIDGSLGRHDAKRGDLESGRFNAAPEGNYEGGLYDNKEDGLNLPGIPRHGTRHAGFLEADGFYESHGNENEYGFLRRPSYKSDVEPS